MKKFYVYELTDPRCGSVFYVGKGQRDRVYQHQRDAINGVQGAKCDRIRAILADGLEVKQSIIKRFSDEHDAIEFEAERIADYGLDNLTNVFSRGCAARGVDENLIKLTELARAIRKMVDIGRPRWLLIPGGQLDLRAIFDNWTKQFSALSDKVNPAQLHRVLRKYQIQLEVPIRENG